MMSFIQLLSMGCMLLALHALPPCVHRCIVRQKTVSLQLGDGTTTGRGFNARPRPVTADGLLSGRGGGAVGAGSKSRAQQVATVSSNSTCICGSGDLYMNCCKLLHDQAKGGISLLDAAPTQITRARYAAYALGMPDYLIHTSHHTNRDYQRHISSNKDLTKAYKSWCKEIITKNSEVFEFLKLDLLNSSQHSNASVENVWYNVIVREKSTSKLVAFQERATYLRDDASSHTLLRSSATSSRRDTPYPLMRWFYAQGSVTPMGEEELASQLSSLPKYSVQDTIRDRW